MENRKRGRPTKIDQIRLKNPADRMRSLKAEIDSALDFLIEREDDYYTLYPRDDEDSKMAMQQIASRADSLMVLLLNLKLAICLAHDHPYKLL